MFDFPKTASLTIGLLVAAPLLQACGNKGGGKLESFDADEEIRRTLGERKTRPTKGRVERRAAPTAKGALSARRGP